MAEQTPSERVREEADRPVDINSGAGGIKNRSVKEQIAAEKFAQEEAARKSRRTGVRIGRVATGRPGGA